MDELVQRLSNGRHEVEVSLRPVPSVSALTEAIRRGYVHVRFTQTRGGTELGLTLDQDRSALSPAVLAAGVGDIRVVGELTLNSTKVRCTADIELPSLKGTGWLEPLSN